MIAADLRTTRGDISYRAASHLELGDCWLVEGLGASRKFGSKWCKDLEDTLAEVRGARSEVAAGDDGGLGSLEKALERALQLHVVVAFGH